MRFYSRDSQPRYVIVPRTYTHFGNGQRELNKGLAVQFHNHILDTLDAQQEEGWTNEERKEVEDHLQNHRDFGSSIRYLDASPAEAEAALAEEDTGPVEFCVWMVQTSEGLSACGERSTAGDYCEKHAAMADAPEKHANRGRAREKVG